MDRSDISEKLQEAVRVLKQGGVVIFPTDTAFGIGCRMDDEEAVKKVFSIRKRPVTQAVPVLVDSIDMAKKYVLDIPQEVRTKLLDVYWPGALTAILGSNVKKVPSLVRGGGVSVGLRIPNHPVPLSLIQALDVPLIGPSANFHGDPTPYEFADVSPQLFHLVDYMIPGTCMIKKESTVVDCTVTPWKIVRQGAVRVEL